MQYLGTLQQLSPGSPGDIPGLSLGVALRSKAEARKQRPVASTDVMKPGMQARVATAQAYSQLQAGVEGPGLVKFYGALQQGSNLLILSQYMPVRTWL